MPLLSQLSAYTHKYKGWLMAFFIPASIVFLARYGDMGTSVSSAHLQKLIADGDVAQITLSKNRLSIRNDYVVKIKLTAKALKKYGSDSANVFFFADDAISHLKIANYAQSNLAQLKKTASRHQISVVYEENYNWANFLYKFILGSVVILVMLSLVRRSYPS